MIRLEKSEHLSYEAFLGSTPIGYVDLQGDTWVYYPYIAQYVQHQDGVLKALAQTLGIS